MSSAVALDLWTDVRVIAKHAERPPHLVSVPPAPPTPIPQESFLATAARWLASLAGKVRPLMIGVARNIAQDPDSFVANLTPRGRRCLRASGWLIARALEDVDNDELRGVLEVLASRPPNSLPHSVSRLSQIVQVLASESGPEEAALVEFWELLSSGAPEDAVDEALDEAAGFEATLIPRDPVPYDAEALLKGE